jgi:hypothetical protein
MAMGFSDELPRSGEILMAQKNDYGAGLLNGMRLVVVDGGAKRNNGTFKARPFGSPDTIELPADLTLTAPAMPGSGGAVYLAFDGTSGAWKLNREPVEPKSLGRILVPQHGLFEGCIEWANSSPLQKIQRQLLGIAYNEPMSERLLQKPLSPIAYKKETDGPALTLGFVGFMLDDGANVKFENSSMGAKKAVNALATAATQALAAFGELVHPVIELGSSSYDNKYRTIYDPKLTVIGYVTDKRAREVNVVSDGDIITKPTASQAKLRRETKEPPAL